MANQLKEALVEALDKPAMDEGVKNLLATTLEDSEPKRGRGRPRKDEQKSLCRADSPTKCKKHGFAKKVLIEEAKEALRKRDRLNPQPTKALQKEAELIADLRELDIDLADAPDDKAETENMIRDLEDLRKEAELETLDETFPSFAAHRQKWKEYIELKNQARRLYRQAELMMKKKALDNAAEVVEVLKHKPKEIEAKYKEILDSYDRLCDDLCKIIDGTKAERAAQDPEELEEQKQGYGMMQGEDFASYKKRLKSLGLGGSIPTTVEHIDEIVEQTERRWRSVAGVSHDEFKVIKENFRKSVDNMMKRSSFATNRGIIGVNEVLEGYLPSLHELMQSTGRRAKQAKDEQIEEVLAEADFLPIKAFEEKCFGITKRLKPHQYEKYGCLHLLNAEEDDWSIGGQFGRNVIRWKPSKVVATMTMTDSILLARDGLNYISPCLVTNPSPCCFNPSNQDAIETFKEKPLNVGIESMCTLMGIPYIELQLHGEDVYDASAIESISFGSAYDMENLSFDAIQTLGELGIPLFVGGQEIALVDGRNLRVVERGSTGVRNTPA